MNTLDDAIDRLYIAFANVPPARHIEGCPCCICNKNIEKLLSTCSAKSRNSDAIRKIPLEAYGYVRRRRH